MNGRGLGTILVESGGRQNRSRGGHGGNSTLKPSGSMPSNVNGFCGWGYRVRRFGSGSRSSGLMPLIISPRKEGTSFPPMTSVGEDRGFANWPAIQAIRRTGILAPQDQSQFLIVWLPQMSTILICKSTLIFASIGS
jgi:hypothetical protein